MFCTQCGTEVLDDAKFCTSCGKRFDVNHEAGVGSSGESVKNKETPRSIRPANEVGVVETSRSSAIALDGASRIHNEDEHEGLGGDRDAWLVNDPENFMTSSATLEPEEPLLYGAFRGNTAPLPRSDNSAVQQKTAAGKKSRLPIVVVAIAVAAMGVALAIVMVDPFGWRSIESAADSAAVVERTTIAGNSSSKDDAIGDEAGSSERSSSSVSVSTSVQETESDNGGKSVTAPPSSQTDNASTYVLFDSSTRIYTEAEFEAMGLHDLYLARNEIFARHGRIFASEELKSYFGSKDWYVPRYTAEQFDSMKSLLSDIEKKNAELMLSVEKRRNSPYI